MLQKMLGIIGPAPEETNPDWRAANNHTTIATPCLGSVAFVFSGLDIMQSQRTLAAGGLERQAQPRAGRQLNQRKGAKMQRRKGFGCWVPPPTGELCKPVQPRMDTDGHGFTESFAADMIHPEGEARK
jgi:hypothetical protein